MANQRLTFHCDLCSRNWPYIEGFNTCKNPDCDGNPCRGLRLDEPSTMYDHIMTYDEARQEIQSFSQSSAAAKPLPIKRGPTAAELRSLMSDLDGWARAAPWFMKGHR